MKKSSRRRLIYVCLLHCSPRISYFYGIERKYTQSSLQLYSHFPCNCNGDVIRCRRPMITCNLLRRFLSDCHQTVLQCLPWSLSLSYVQKRILQHVGQKKIFTILSNWFCTTLPWWAAASSSRGLNTKIHFMLISMHIVNICFLSFSLVLLLCWCYGAHLTGV